jgi:hypothetical protein
MRCRARAWSHCGRTLLRLRCSQAVENGTSAGRDVGRDQVARLMHAAGIHGVRRGKRLRTTTPDPTAARHPDLVKRNFGASAPN